MDINTNPLAKELKILGDEKRFMIVSLLLEFDLCVEALAARLDISKSAVSQHLKILRDAGFVRGEKRGYFTHYSVDRGRLIRISGQLMEMAEIRKSKCNSGSRCCGDRE
ncbi:metalloregulator ArsR/SmtB family transcription factor [Maridesulfovibrio sp.]|uniref:ArsR/SmtB family transcription factor n=1 Tax=Maridesulfovibrio sp. TaxID=2795000 RepID=UPI0029CA6CB0|nr:metalloregulator ArsR/SmtB family transcription factor [Maridesulfovibrio sp.]